MLFRSASASQNSFFTVSGDTHQLTASGSVDAYSRSGLATYQWQGFAFSETVAMFSTTTDLLFTLENFVNPTLPFGSFVRSGDNYTVNFNPYGTTSLTLTPGTYTLKFGVNRDPAVGGPPDYNARLNFTPVPEPAALALLAPLILSPLRRCRCRRSAPLIPPLLRRRRQHIG